MIWRISRLPTRSNRERLRPWFLLHFHIPPRLIPATTMPFTVDQSLHQKTLTTPTRYPVADSSLPPTRAQQLVQVALPQLDQRLLLVPLPRPEAPLLLVPLPRPALPLPRGVLLQLALPLQLVLPHQLDQPLGPEVPAVAPVGPAVPAAPMAEAWTATEPTQVDHFHGKEPGPEAAPSLHPAKSTPKPVIASPPSQSWDGKRGAVSHLA